MTRDFDLVLQGATGFTGGWAARELAERAPEGFRWAVAGRDPRKVEAVATRFGVPALVADGFDAEATRRLAARARVVLSCAGPFSRYGDALVAACVEAGTHYADLTGELPWIHAVERRHHEAAVAAGVALVPSSGFDSVPTDLGVQAFVAEVGPSLEVTGLWRLRGGLNGGTLHSALALAEEGSLDGTAHVAARRGPSRFPVPALDRWAAPFVMAPVNEDVVRRSAQRLAEDGVGYGPGFRYHEHLSVRSRSRAWAVAAAQWTLEGLLARRFGRALLRRFGPRPGEGPSEELVRNGFAHLTLLAGPLDRPDAVRRWEWVGDPGNLVTVRCLVQTGLALAAGEARRAGVLTPAAALGDRLLRRLLAIGAVRRDGA